MGCGKVGKAGTTVKSGRFALRWEERVNPDPRGANTVTDTRALLNRIAEFRKRLDAMPRLTPGALKTSPNPPASTPETALDQQVRAGSRTQALIGQSLRELAGTDEKPAPALTNRACPAHRRIPTGLPPRLTHSPSTTGRRRP
jgi:hypothetical protein